MKAVDHAVQYAEKGWHVLPYILLSMENALVIKWDVLAQESTHKQLTD